ncbi:hypothetical protein MB46_10425 [Arthrobacter alpinus]|uniref:hypothetical protein n=1 Tax=Arthrobacter alpinus TaxID=656366 RepID=UPI0005CB1BDC|nr:hypothetical protein [Arthrobacter alpinus]ALV45836.1 hypothetical protein MB46_10425 [Arthrobacter alpinus]
MDDLDGIPRGGHEPDPLAAFLKLLQKLGTRIGQLERAAPQRSMSLTDGGDLTIKNGGRVTIEDQGEVTVDGEGRSGPTGNLIKVAASLANRLADNVWIGFTYLVPGLYFTADGDSRGATDPRVVSDSGKDVSAISAVEPLPYGPQVGPSIVSKGTFTAGSWSAGIGSFAWDESINHGGGDGIAGLRGAGNFSTTPYDIGMLLTNHTDGPDGIPIGPAVWIHGTLEEGILHLYGREGVNITGPFTVDGLPVGGAVTSVAGKTGAVTLVKGDVGLSSVDNTSDLSKPVSTDTQTALNGKASTAIATTTTDGLMAAADKVKLDGVATAKTSHYIATGSKGNFAIGDQAISVPVYQAALSTGNLGTPAAGQISVTDAGIYMVTFSCGLFTDASMTTIKSATGRSFMDISDAAGTAYARTPIPVGEDQGSGNHGAGVMLAAGATLKFNIIQTSGGVAYYRARIWLTKLP